MDKFHGIYKWTNELAQTIIRETGLPCTFALSINKTVSKIGTGEGKQKQNLEIPEHMVQQFLNPLSVQKIPMVGEKTFQLLSRIGIRTIKTLSSMPAEALQKMIGKNAIELWKKYAIQIQTGMWGAVARIEAKSFDGLRCKDWNV